MNHKQELRNKKNRSGSQKTMGKKEKKRVHRLSWPAGGGVKELRLRLLEVGGCWRGLAAFVARAGCSCEEGRLRKKRM